MAGNCSGTVMATAKTDAKKDFAIREEIRKLKLLRTKIIPFWIMQQEYEEYWVRNVWGFGDKMRDYLLEGKRRMPLGRV